MSKIYLVEYEIQVTSRLWSELYWQYSEYETYDLADAKEFIAKRAKDDRYKNFRLSKLVKEPIE